MQKSVSLPTGVRISYVEQGDPDGTPVIFLHGVTDSWRSFRGVLPLLPANVRALAISQRGHGDSSRPAAGYRLRDLSDDLAAFMDVLGLPAAIVVGHSMGASVAQQFALDHPGRVSRLALIGAFAGFQDPDFHAFVRTSILTLTDPITCEFVREWQLSTLARTMDADHLDAVVAETLKVPAFVWHATFGGFIEGDDVTSALGRVTVPTLLIWGDRDTYATRAAQERLLQLLPQAVLITYDGHGHALHWEDPRRVADDLVPFLTASSDSVFSRRHRAAVSAR